MPSSKQVRNWVPSKEDVKAVVNSDGQDVDILAIDLGQAFTVAASAYMAKNPQ